MGSRFALRLLYLACYPALSVVFLLLGLPRFMNPLTFILISWPIPILSFQVFGLIDLEWFKQSNFWWESPFWATFGLLFFIALFTSIGSIDFEWIFIGVGGFYALMWFITLFLSGRIAFFDRSLKEDRIREITILWFIYVLSASFVTSFGLSRVWYAVSLIPIVIFAVFGLFGPEVIPRFFPGALRPMLLYGAYFIAVFAFTGILDWINLALYSGVYLDDLFLMLGVGWIAVNSMLVSRCTLEAIQKLVSQAPVTDEELD